MKLEMNIDYGGRKVVSSDIKQSAEEIVTLIKLDDGTFIKLIQNADNVNIESNKKLHSPDGKTIIIGD